MKDESTWGSISMNSSVLKGFCPWEKEKKCHKLKSAISHKTLSGKWQVVPNLEGAMESCDLRDFVLHHVFKWSDNGMQLGALITVQWLLSIKYWSPLVWSPQGGRATDDSAYTDRQKQHQPWTDALERLRKEESSCTDLIFFTLQEAKKKSNKWINFQLKLRNISTDKSYASS